MKTISKIQARINAKLNDIENDVAAINTVESVLLIIGVLSVIAIVFAFVINKLVPTTNKIGSSIKDAPERMAEQVDNSINNF